MKTMLCVVTILITIDVSGQNASVALLKADSFYTSGNYEKAIRNYEIALKENPENSIAWNRLGFSYHNLKRYDLALVQYEQALKHNPSPQVEQVIHMRMTRVYALQKKNDSAFQHLTRGVALGYANPKALMEDKDFGNIRQDRRFDSLLKQCNSNAFPCMDNVQAREFDFWIGEWDAYVTGTKQLAGRSRIEMASGGCMILENWTSEGQIAYNGKSMNFIDPASGKWKQVWVGSNGINVSEFLNGEYKDGAMRFVFETTDAKGNKTLTHFYFYNLAVDQVRQFHETSADEGVTWTTTYDFTYVRRK